MVTKALIGVLLFSAIFSCSGSVNYKTTGKAQMKIEFELMPEGGDTIYSITWNDTLGLYNGLKLNIRPREIWCVISSGKDTVGYYKGLSTPSSFTYFVTKDSLITISFMEAPNFFDDNLTDAERQRILDRKENTTFFRPIGLNIKSNLRKKLSYVLVER